MTCPYCHRTDRQIKNGFNPSGSQRWRCQHCRRVYTPEPKPNGYAEATRLEAVKLYVDGNVYFRVDGISILPAQRKLSHRV